MIFSLDEGNILNHITYFCKIKTGLFEALSLLHSYPLSIIYSLLQHSFSYFLALLSLTPFYPLSGSGGCSEHSPFLGSTQNLSNLSSDLK
jgi:hypothetical protein